MSQQPHPNQNKPQKNAATPNNKSPMGGSLVGLMSGLVLATLIIIAVLLVLNSNSKRDFKNEPVLSSNAPKTTETLTPNNHVPVENNSTPAITGSDIVGNPSNEPNLAQQNAPSNQNDVNQNTANVDTPNGNVPQNHDVASTAPNSNNQPTIAESNKVPQANANTRFNQPNQQDELALQDGDMIGEPTFAPPANKAKPKPQQPAKPKNTNKNNVASSDKPTPQEILDYGSVENARAAKAQQNSVKSTGKGNVILQAGSFNTREYAETQRAKLALLGVQTNVAEAVVNGKKVYRVQTSKLNSEKANQTKSVLDSHGVNTYQRSAN